MICGEWFKGDEDASILMDVQYDNYGALLPILFDVPIRRFLRAASLLGVRNETVARVNEIRARGSLDHRILQPVHDHIAAAYRFLKHDGGQLSLGDLQHTKEQVTADWVQFFEESVNRLAEDDFFVRAVVSCFAGWEHGVDDNPHDVLTELLDRTYANLAEVRLRHPV